MGKDGELLQKEQPVQQELFVEPVTVTAQTAAGPVQEKETARQPVSGPQREPLPKTMEKMTPVYYRRYRKRNGKTVFMEEQRFLAWRQEKAQEKQAREQERLEEQKRAQLRWEEIARQRREEDEAQRVRQEEEERLRREEEQRQFQEMLRREYEEQQRIGEELARRWEEERRQREAVQRERENLMPRPTFRQYDQEELRSMGKIKRTAYRVKKHFWDKKERLCQQAYTEMMHLRREGRERFGTVAANVDDMEQALNQNAQREEKEALYRMARNQVENWQKFLTGHGLERAYVAVQTYCTVNYSALIEGNPYEKFQNDELIDAYLQNDRDRARVPRKYFTNERRGVLTNGMMADTDKLVDGAKLAKLPQDTVLCNWVDAGHLAQLLGTQQENLGQALQGNPEFREKGMMAGMLEREQQFPLRGMVEMVILAKAGTRAIPVNGTSLVRGRKNSVDMLLAPGTRMRVIGSREMMTRDHPDDIVPNVHGQTTWRVYVEVLPNDEQRG